MAPPIRAGGSSWSAVAVSCKGMKVMSTDGASNGAARRILSLWLPSLSTDRLARRRPELRDKALATVIADGGRHLVAVNRAAEEEGLAPGMTVADSRALASGLLVLPADPVSDHRAMSSLAFWCGRYTPWVA